MEQKSGKLVFEPKRLQSDEKILGAMHQGLRHKINVGMITDEEREFSKRVFEARRSIRTIGITESFDLDVNEAAIAVEAIATSVAIEITTYGAAKHPENIIGERALPEIRAFVDSTPNVP